MRCLAGLEWGADVLSLKRIYVSLIRSRLEYGSIAYGSASKSVLSELDKVQAEALRICIGGVRTSPVCALQVETGEMPLRLRRRQLMANYWLSLKDHGENHPTKQVVQECWERGVAQDGSFGWIGGVVARDMGVENKEFCPAILWPSVPIWLLNIPKVDLEIWEEKRRNKNSDLKTEYHNHIDNRYREHLLIFTDGSKDPVAETTGAAVVVQGMNVELYKRTNNYLTVYTVELYAILMAVRWMEQMQPCKVLICSDSLSAIQSIGSGASHRRPDLVYEILLLLSQVTRRGSDVTLLWVPAHIGVLGNEKVDKLAKEAVKKRNIDVNLQLSKSEGKHIVWKKINQEWQQYWEQETKGRRLYSLQNRVGITARRGGNRREQVVLTRLRIGHTHLNSTLKILGKHPTGLREECHQPETVEHALIACRRYETERGLMIIEMRKIGLTDISVKNILECGGKGKGIKLLFDFLRASGLIKRI
ncbi:uncharacterized protein LOC129701820 isoform X1 [Leucoraja erinacea]|uniref:uncharacterized protein LOC129701820 isoform X1 n=1 Tax=Leucoraja erinaceus TaxID=7782 RepID=UPI002455BF6E|nr:uncharacterized protein LOC129701820 isoform X1 [Leucoraja erinacea]XP_055499260.1 uncharacterized protein LOC129701820 isoform X1 [Leucoraja erinacea]XP_055499261.1 uncharacterized protein LOC129701820 isoform X1 [Leucoraja erinacea]XP_055499262.1 uncharacterized protein LOC129701820 isoform X1 [Leucoraja erinacea]XP_055499263.1 uncharacterized protein LOC129701820 isoform X1 [Leucoraja erinacea]XP_055499264.1 uncharacterized protein LOC129701820 isoform X1 [Leucoraja erinacea]